MKKIDSITFIRGVAIILVIVHHSVIPMQHTLASILAFHMPFFFILNGFLIHLNESYLHYSPFQFIKKRFIQLMIPTYLFAFFDLGLNFLVNKLNGVTLPLKHYILTIIFPKSAYVPIAGSEQFANFSIPFTHSFWFLPCMFITSISSFLILKVLSKIVVKKKYSTLVLLALVVIFFLINKTLSNHQNLFQVYYFHWDIATQAIAWVFIGYLLTPLIKKILTSKALTGSVCLMAICLFVLNLSVRTNPGQFLMYINSYGNFKYAIIGALSGSIGLFLFANDLYGIVQLKFKKICSIITWFGKNSLAVFPIHLIILELLWYFEIEFLNQWMILALMLLGSYTITKILSRWKFGKLMMGQ